MKSKIRLFIRNLFRSETVKRAVRVALIVGPVLILINHYDEIIHLNFSWIFFLKSTLTFFVPYCVSAYSSAQAYVDKTLSEARV